MAQKALKHEHPGTTFCRAFPWTIDIEWFGLLGVTKLDDDRRAEISLEYRSVMDHYCGFTIRIVSKRTGEIAKTFLRFSSFLATRSDNRADYVGPFEVIAYCKWDWYIAVPSDTSPFVWAVQRYIDQWR